MAANGSGTLLPLAQLAPQSGSLKLPDWPELEVFRLQKMASQSRSGKQIYFLVSGELLIDLASGAFLHLRPGDAAEVEGSHRLTAVSEAVMAAWKRS